MHVKIRHTGLPGSIKMYTAYLVHCSFVLYDLIFKHNKLLHNFSVWVQKIGAFVKALVLGFFSTRAEPFSRGNIAKIIKKDCIYFRTIIIISLINCVLAAILLCFVAGTSMYGLYIGTAGIGKNKIDTM